jgi:hypothetical protein
MERKYGRAIDKVKDSLFEIQNRISDPERAD